MSTSQSTSGVPGGFARKKARGLDTTFIAANRRMLLRMAALLLLAGTAIWSIFFLVGMPGGSLAMGAFIGSFGVAAFYEIRVWSGSAPIHRGAAAEMLVAETLSDSVPRGWQVRSAVSFAEGDIDHVIIGDTMVVMVETKSTVTSWNLTSSGVLLNGSDPTIGARWSLRRIRQLIAGGASSGIDGAAWLIVQSPGHPERDSQLPAVRSGVTVARMWQLDALAATLPAVVDLDRAAANVASVDKFIDDRRPR